MKAVSRSTLDDIYLLIGKNVHFVSDCELFPEFDIVCKVIRIDILNGEYLFNVNISKPKRKQLTISGNMKNLQYELI